MHNTKIILIFLLLGRSMGAWAQSKPELIYIADPMCTWCYGFASEMAKAKEHFGESVTFHLIMGGLNPFEKDLLDTETKDFFKEHWPEISGVSGQPFSFDLLHPDSAFVYDTEPPSRAVVTVRKLKPEAEFAFFKAVQHAFYENGQNTNKLETYLNLLEKWDINKDAFVEMFFSEDAQTATVEDFAKADLLCKNGFPTVVVRLPSGKVKTISEGYMEAKKLIPKIEKAAGLK